MLIPGAGVFIEADIAGIIARLLGDWPHQNLRLGLVRDPNTYARLTETITELRHAGASDSGNSEGQRKSDPASSDQMLTSTQLGSAVQLSPRRILQLRDEGKLEGIRAGGRWLFAPSQISHARRHRTNKEAA